MLFMKHKMLEYNRIDISQGVDVNKRNASKECDICHYWCFKDTSFKYEGSAYRINFWYMSKDDAINIMNNSNLGDKMGVL